MSDGMQQAENTSTGMDTGAAPRRDDRGRFAAGNAHRWARGRSGNPGGRPKGASFAAALARQAVTPVAEREEMANIARTIGLDPDEARNIDVVAGLFYVVLCRLLLRATGGNSRADERLVGMLQVLLRALDPSELRVSGPDGGPISIAAVVANVQTALGMQTAGVADATEPIGGEQPALSTPAAMPSESRAPGPRTPALREPDVAALDTPTE